LDALLSLFEQNYFIDHYGHFKKYIQPLDNENVRRMTDVLSYIASSDEDRRLMETEEEIRQIVDGDFNEEMQKVRYELKKRSEENEQLITKITKNEQVIAEKDKQIAELLARLNSK
jgi:endonuclease/exonuclease/phosphatase family metal-dependent hydrolase